MDRTETSSLSRIDQQVKIRRLSASSSDEIESVSRYPGVLESVVTASRTSRVSNDWSAYFSVCDRRTFRLANLRNMYV